MNTQQMTHAQISVPVDCFSLVAGLVTKLGGHILDDNGVCVSCRPIPELERGGKMLKGLRQRAGLTQKQVGNIIEKTARKVGNYYYRHDPTRTNGAWNNEMGYGLVDAYAALDRASSIVLFENRVITSNFTVTGNEISSGNITVSNNATFTMSAPQGITIFNPLIVNSGVAGSIPDGFIGIFH